MKEMFEKTGVQSPEIVRSVFPPIERINRGPVAVIECYQRIPCNPCATACKAGAIKPFEDINDRPDIDFERCTGCGLCVSKCPGLSIMLVDGSRSEENVVFSIPYEFLPLPQENDYVDALDRAGESIGKAKILKVINRSYQDRTPIIQVEISREKMYLFRNIKIGGNLNG
jgi:Fe-S-cluster-containing hydrogenase component 2